MALKFSYQYWFDEKGEIQFGDSSFVTCADDDPYRLSDERIVIEKSPETEKDPT